MFDCEYVCMRVRVFVWVHVFMCISVCTGSQLLRMYYGAVSAYIKTLVHGLKIFSHRYRDRLDLRPLVLSGD